MDIGVFIPIANNGWLISETSPQYKPSFDLNKQIVQRAEHHGLDFALSMVKLRGFGGKTEFWDYALESFTLMAGIAAVTTRIKLFASVAVLTMPPAMVARMATSIDSIAPGRFGVNIVSGWQLAEFDQMGLWPGDAHFMKRYEYCGEYVSIMRELWDTGTSDFKGDFFTMRDCRMLPMPDGKVEIVGAGQSDKGIAFVAEHGDYNFCFGTGKNTPLTVAPSVARLVEAGKITGRKVGAYVLFMVIAADTDEEAEGTWQSYRGGVDVDALAWMADQGSKDSGAGAGSTAATINLPEAAVNLNIGLLVGSHAKVASLLDKAAGIEGVSGIMLIFDDFLDGMEIFGTRVQPLMQCRADRHTMQA